MGNVRKGRLSLQHGESMRENTDGDMKESETTYLVNGVPFGATTLIV